MKKVSLILLSLILLFSFVSCGESEQNDSAKKSVLEVKLNFNTEKSVNNRIFINTTLPVGTLLDVDVFVGNKYRSTEQVAVKSDSYSNYFITEPQTDQDGNIIGDGNYILEVKLVDPSSQPKSVQNVIGTNGELMSGDNVLKDSENPSVKGVTYHKLIVKKGDKFNLA